MSNFDKVIEFVSDYYKDKDIMHDLSHIERVIETAKKLIDDYDCDF